MRGLGRGGLMDFVVSKVVMSICALTVAGVLSGAVRTALSPDPDRELDSVLASLERTVDALAIHGCEGAVEWTVPATHSGGVIEVSFGHGLVLLRSEDLYRATSTSPVLHTWEWGGNPINATTVDDLDRLCPAVSGASGDTILISAVRVLVEDAAKLLFFVRPG